MEIVIHFKDLVYLGSHLFGMVISAVLLYVGVRKYAPNVFLGFSFFTLTYGTFIAWLVSSGNFVHFPALYRTGNIAGLLFPAFFYLYIRAVLYPNSHSKWDLLFFPSDVSLCGGLFPRAIWDVDCGEKSANHAGDL